MSTTSQNSILQTAATAVGILGGIHGLSKGLGSDTAEAAGGKQVAILEEKRLRDEIKRKKEKFNQEMDMKMLALTTKVKSPRFDVGLPFDFLKEKGAGVPNRRRPGERKNKLRGVHACYVLCGLFGFGLGSSKVSSLNDSQGNGAGRPNNISDRRSEEREIAPTSPPDQDDEITGGYFNVTGFSDGMVYPTFKEIIEQYIREGYKVPPCPSDPEEDNRTSYKDFCEFCGYDPGKRKKKKRPPSPEWVPAEIYDFSKWGRKPRKRKIFC